MIFVYTVCVGKVHSWLDSVLLVKSSTWDFELDSEYFELDSHN